MTALDKRIITTTKRARNKRKKAQRTHAKALAAAEATAALTTSAPLDDDCDSGAETPTGGSSADERPIAPLPPVGREELRGLDDDDDDDNNRYDEHEDEDELVLVGRPHAPERCIAFVPAGDVAAVQARAVAHAEVAGGGDGGGWDPRGLFSLRIPAFRETREGYTTYTIALGTFGPRRRQFEVERRYSEFVAFAHDLQVFMKTPAFARLRTECRAAASRRCRPIVDKLVDVAVDDSDNQEGSEYEPFVWELPPKTWFRLTQTPALEERRGRLERAMETLLMHDHETIAHIPLVREFLQLDAFAAEILDAQQ